MSAKQNIFQSLSFWKKFSRYFAVIISLVILLVVGQVSMLQGTLLKGLDIAKAEVNGLGVQFDSGNGANWIGTIFNDSGSGFEPGTVEAQFGAYHCKTAGDFSCAPDIAGDVLSTLKFENVLLPVPDRGTSTQIALDVAQVTCGRVQIDLGLSDGRGILGGKVYNFGTNCPDGTGGGPGESPAPTSTPGGQACTPGEWSGATCARCNAAGTGMEADGSDWGDFSSNSSGWCGCAQKYAQSTQGKAYDSGNFPQCFGAQPSPSACVAPGVPQNLKIDGQVSGTTFPTDKRTFNLTWDGVSGATGYNVRLDDPRTPENPDIVQDNVQGTSLQVQLRDPGVTYFWWIHSVNTCGGSAANNANFSIAGSGGPVSSPSPVSSPTPTPASCDQFVNTTTCGQPSYDTCSPACSLDGKAIYNCHASQNSNCQGTLLCESENNRCQASPAPSNCEQFVTHTTCGQPSYDQCSPACTADGHAIYNCVASQRSDCRGTLFCDPENNRCQASPAPSASVAPTPTPSTSASPSPVASSSSGSDSTSSAQGGQGGNVTVNISQQSSSSPQPQVAGATAQITELPRTGLPLAAWAVAAFLPLGLRLRRFAKGVKETTNLYTNPHYMSQKRIFKK